MFTARRRVSASIAIVLALGGAVALSACSANPLESIVNQATDGKVSLGGESIPDGFPSAVPVAEGDVVFGIAVGDVGSRSYNVTISTGTESPLDAIETQFADAGFDSQVQASGGDGVGTVIFSSDDWNVALVVAHSDDGYTANYTVTPADSSH